MIKTKKKRITFIPIISTNLLGLHDGEKRTVTFIFTDVPPNFDAIFHVSFTAHVNPFYFRNWNKAGLIK